LIKTLCITVWFEHIAICCTYSFVGTGNCLVVNIIKVTDLMGSSWVFNQFSHCWWLSCRLCLHKYEHCRT